MKMEAPFDGLLVFINLFSIDSVELALKIAKDTHGYCLKSYRIAQRSHNRNHWILSGRKQTNYATASHANDVKSHARKKPLLAG